MIYCFKSRGFIIEYGRNLIFLESAIQDYNVMFHTNYDTSSDKFQNYYKDVSLRMKNKELDMRFTGLSWTLPGFER